MTRGGDGTTGKPTTPPRLGEDVRIVFADMDDTFLAEDKSIPAANMRLLDELARTGCIFVPCTGRPVIAVPDQIRAHDAARYAVGSNGSVIQDLRTNVPLHVRAIRKDSVLALFELVCDLNATFDIFADGHVYSERWRYERMREYDLDQPTLEVLLRVREPVDLTIPQLVERAGYIEKITCFWRDETARDGIARALEQVDGLSKSSGHPRNFELQSEGTSKGTALVWLCDYLGIPVAQSTAFGDAENDIPLLEAAGDGVAMANAIPTVRAVADHTTSSCNEAGVARYFQ